MKTIKVIAPAKVNLYLGIGSRQEDGYHQATTAMHSLALHDTLQLTLVEAGEQVLLAEPGDAAQPVRELELAVEPGSGLAVSAHMVWAAGLDAPTVPDEKNLACRAVHALAQEVGRKEDEHVRIVIEKQIPHQTGLGGGSADAAAALVGVASLWGIDDMQVLERVAQQLSVDVAFFLHGGCVLLEGRGDVPVRNLEPRRDTLVIVKPEGGVSTVEAYAAFDAAPVALDDGLGVQLSSAQDAQGVPLFNNLSSASESLHDGLSRVRMFLADQEGVEGVLLCGSGAGTFAVCRDFATAQRVAAAAQAQGWWSRATSFSPLGAALLPER